MKSLMQKFSLGQQSALSWGPPSLYWVVCYRGVGGAVVRWHYIIFLYIYKEILLLKLTVLVELQVFSALGSHLDWHSQP